MHGLVERFNQSLKKMLHRFADQEKPDWAKLLPYLLFAVREVPQFLTGFGFIIGKGKVKPVATKAQVRSLLGLAGYYCRFIPNLSTIAAHLTNLTKKNTPNKISRPLSLLKGI